MSQAAWRAYDDANKQIDLLTDELHRAYEKVESLEKQVERLKKTIYNLEGYRGG